MVYTMGTLQLLTPQKLPVSFGALGALKILSCQLWLHSLVTFVSPERPKKQSAQSVFAFRSLRAQFRNASDTRSNDCQSAARCKTITCPWSLARRMGMVLPEIRLLQAAIVLAEELTIVQDRKIGSRSGIKVRLRRSDRLGLSRTQRQRRTQPCPQYAAFSLKC